MAEKKKGAFSSLCEEGKRKFGTVMSEFSSNKLRSSSGEKVNTREQAVAIAFSEARKRCKDAS